MVNFGDVLRRQNKQEQSFLRRQNKQEQSFIMGTNIRNINNSVNKKKKKTLTPKERLYIWEHSKIYGRTCHICSQRIIKQSDLELDHIIPYSKGGTKLNLSHRDCNRMKSSGSLTRIQKRLALPKTNKKKATAIKSKKVKVTNSANVFGLKNYKEPKVPDWIMKS